MSVCVRVCVRVCMCVFLLELALTNSSGGRTVGPYINDNDNSNNDNKS